MVEKQTHPVTLCLSILCNFLPCQEHIQIPTLDQSPFSGLRISPPPLASFLYSNCEKLGIVISHIVLETAFADIKCTIIRLKQFF